MLQIASVCLFPVPAGRENFQGQMLAKLHAQGPLCGPASGSASGAQLPSHDGDCNVR